MSFAADDYAIIRSGCQSSAHTAVPIIMEHIQPRSVIDFGCGEGWWLREFETHGCVVLGVDGPSSGAALRPDQHRVVNLANSPPIDFGQHDLALCLEVAEHLPPHRADWLIETLCQHAPCVAFSAAIPGQGGQGHVNEQWPSYWAERFAQHGYRTTGALRWALWQLAPAEIENWYAQNLLIATSQPDRISHLYDGPASEPLSVVHPVLWDARR